MSLRQQDRPGPKPRARAGVGLSEWRSCAYRCQFEESVGLGLRPHPRNLKSTLVVGKYPAAEALEEAVTIALERMQRELGSDDDLSTDADDPAGPCVRELA